MGRASRHRGGPAAGLALASLLLSLRKRLRLEWLGKFAWWRVLHALLGLACAVLLVLHTGFHMGANLNQILLIDFIGVLLLGAATGAVVGFSHRLPASAAGSVRRTWGWAHLLLTWPLPALVAAHILTVYYF